MYTFEACIITVNSYVDNSSHYEDPSFNMSNSGIIWGESLPRVTTASHHRESPPRGLYKTGPICIIAIDVPYVQLCQESHIAISSSRYTLRYRALMTSFVQLILRSYSTRCLVGVASQLLVQDSPPLSGKLSSICWKSGSVPKYRSPKLPEAERIDKQWRWKSHRTWLR